MNTPKVKLHPNDVKFCIDYLKDRKDTLKIIKSEITDIYSTLRYAFKDPRITSIEHHISVIDKELDILRSKL